MKVRLKKSKENSEKGSRGIEKLRRKQKFITRRGKNRLKKKITRRIA